MTVRWLAVFAGVFVDILISSVLALFASPAYLDSPNLAQTGDVVLLVLSVVLTTISGYVAGRIAGTNRPLHGLLVQIVNILLAQLGPPLSRVTVLAYAAACLFAALGGYLSRYPAQAAR